MYEIITDRPIPPPAEPYPFANMGVGHCFIFPTSQRAAVQKAAKRYAKTVPGWDFTIGKTGPTYTGLWRVADIPGVRDGIESVVFDCIARRPGGVTKREIQRGYPRLGGAAIDRTLAAMIAGNRITWARSQGGRGAGRPTIYYKILEK